MANVKFFQPLHTKDAWISTFAEFIATFLFVYLGCGAVVSSGLVLGESQLDQSRLLIIAIAHGLAIAVLASATAGLSGGHINPAVTFAMMTVRQIPILKGIMYIVAQCAGGVLGAGLLRNDLPRSLEGSLGAHDVNTSITRLDAVVLETVLSFTLIFVIFGTAVDRRGTGNTAPLAIGFTVLVDHLVGVPFTGASMNPARSLAPAVWLPHYKWKRDFWVYVAGPFLGATLAAVLYRSVFLTSHTPTTSREMLGEKTNKSANPDFDRSTSMV